MYEAVFAVADPSESVYTASTAHNNCEIELWCNGHSDILFVQGSEIEIILDHIESDVGIAEKNAENGSVVVVTESCLIETSDRHMEHYINRHDCLLLPPRRYRRGEKHCRILALDGGKLSSLYQQLTSDGYEVEIPVKKEIDHPSKPNPLLASTIEISDLTTRQYEVLLLAAEEGYYEIPRETTTEELATELDISRRTLDQHLRLAENKLITSIACQSTT